MNDRIKELMTKSGMLYTLSKPTHIAEDGTHTVEEHYVYDKFDPTKFAELLVEDCVSQIAMIGISNFDCEDVVWTVERVIEIIQERYGVTNED